MYALKAYVSKTQLGIILEKWYVYNNFTTFLQQILSGRLLLVVIVGLKK